MGNTQDLNFYERLSAVPLQHFLQDSQSNGANRMADLDSDDHGGSQASSGWLFSKRLSKRLGFLVLWWQSLVSKRFLAHLLQKLRRPNRKSNAVGLYTGGTKRHYA